MDFNKKALGEEELKWFLEKMKLVEAFSILSDDELKELLSHMRGFEFKAGITLVNQGEAANLFFIVQTGEVEVLVQKFLFKKKKVAILKSGDFFGESVLVSNPKRSATVITKTDTTCFVLLKPSFQTLLNQVPLFKKLIKTTYSKRKAELKKV